MIGDTDDMQDRIKRELPRRWFGDGTARPVLDALLAGLGSAWSSIYGYIAYIRLQSRIATATDSILDQLAWDFLGDEILRKSGENDTTFRARVRREILRPKATRAALISALTDLTGQPPWVFEPANSSDTGGYDFGGCGYDAGGGYGSDGMPYQCLVAAYRPHVGGIPNVDGYDGAAGGYGIGAIEYLSDADTQVVSDQDIRDVITRTIPAATVVWLHIDNVPPLGIILDNNFILDQSALS